MPRSASVLTYYVNVIRIIYASFGIRTIQNYLCLVRHHNYHYFNVIGIIYASFGIRIIPNYLCPVRHQNYSELFMPCATSELTYYFNEIAIIYASFGIRINLLLFSKSSRPRSAFALLLTKSTTPRPASKLIKSTYDKQTRFKKYQSGRSAIKYYIQNKTIIVRCPHAGSSNFLLDIH